MICIYSGKAREIPDVSDSLGRCENEQIHLKIWNLSFLKGIFKVQDKLSSIKRTMLITTKNKEQVEIALKSALH